MYMYQTFLGFKFSFAQKLLSILEKLISEEENEINMVWKPFTFN